MGTSFDINRVSPIVVPPEPMSEDNILRLYERVQKLEAILEQRVDQWNAPSLLSLVSGSTEYKVQFGKFTYAFAGGSTAQNFTLPVAWETSHDLFHICFRPLTSWDSTFQVNGCGASSLTLGTWGIAGTTAQSYEATWISIGK